MTTTKTDASEKATKVDKKTLVTARHAVTQEMYRRGACRAAEVSEYLGLKETTVSSIMYGLYVRKHAERVGRGVYELVSLPENFKPTKGKPAKAAPTKIPPAMKREVVHRNCRLSPPDWNGQRVFNFILRNLGSITTRQ